MIGLGKPQPAALAVSAMLAMTAGCTGAEVEQQTSWGKAGVSYADYRTDAVQCAVQGSQTDMSKQAAFKDTMGGLREQDAILANQQSADPLTDYVMIQRRNFHNNIPELQKFLVSRVTQCLVSRGYSQFALTPAQEQELAAFHKGSEARFEYLYRLASDPKIVADQSIDQPPPQP